MTIVTIRLEFDRDDIQYEDVLEYLDELIEEGSLDFQMEKSND